MRRGGVVPPGRSGLIVIAAVMAPIFIKKLRPAARAVGRGIAKVGETIQKLADEPPKKEEVVETPPVQPDLGTEEDPTTPNISVNAEETTMPELNGDELKSSSPIGHDEIESQEAAEDAGTDTPPEGKPASPKERKERKKLEPDQKLNPRRTRNSQSR